MNQLNPYLQFGSKCREIMTFYKECFDGELTLQTVGESPMASHMPQEAQDAVLHSALMKDGKTVVMASGVMPETEIKKGNNIALCVVCSSKEEIETLFAKLSEGGKVGHPLKEEFFGTIGDFTDKFGMNWMLQFGMGK
ncbi:VOC family protein [soil metagenome]